jgi:hypothetical protein
VSEEVTIAPRFRGPPDSANGGYTCGVLARFIEGPAVEVSLRAPPPLGRPLSVTGDADRVVVRDGDTLVADGEPLDSLDLDPPGPVGFDEAEAASRASPLHQHHPFSTCFVCGPDREPGDGLRLIPGPVDGRDVVAGIWIPDPSLVGDEGAIPSEIEWATLDCPSGNAAMMLVPGLGVSVLARLATRLIAPVDPGVPHVGVGWVLGRDGRKVQSGSALFTADGELVGIGRALWIELRR